VTSIAGNYENLSELSFLPTQGAGQLAALAKWLAKAGLTVDESKRFSDQLKEFLFRNLKANQIRSEYYDFVSALMDTVDQELTTTPT